jgi:hypothetical protein
MRYPMCQMHFPQPTRRNHVALLLTVLGLLSLLVTGCEAWSAAPNGPSSAPPTITPPSVHTPGPASSSQPAAGITAIKPRKQSVPVFSEQDMKEYVVAHPLPVSDASNGSPEVTRAEFLPSESVAHLIGGAALRPPSTLLGYIELSGNFSFPGPVAGDPRLFTRAFVAFDVQTGNLLAYGSLGGATPTPPVDATPTPRTGSTPTTLPIPLITFTGTPLTLIQDCGASTKPVTSFTVTLDNTGSNVSVSWQVATITETVGKSGHIWSSASPVSGTVPEGGVATLTISPESSICIDSQSIVPDATYHVTVKFSPAGSSSGSVTIADTIKSPIPG